MNASDLISNLRALGPQDDYVFWSYLADHWHEMRLSDGMGLLDKTDDIAFFREAARATRQVSDSTKVHSAAESSTGRKVTRPASQLVR